MKSSVLAEVMQAQRNRSGLGQRQAAKLMGCRIDTITGLESGRKIPRDETIWTLGALYCISLSEIKVLLLIAQYYRLNREQFDKEYAERRAAEILKKNRRPHGR